ncbi:unnamed protein product [Cuscuta epithymum]|uniref:Homeobox-leucine zipper protein n=1 Tax=Cuscuta epithymum TaxID=186058 RepID=A0AAV0G2C4_9ASTE|nr:unnamed protein product [Cuscuta epithymum]
MSCMNSQTNHKSLSSSMKHNKKRLNQDQVKLLESYFDSNKKLEPERKLELARDLGVPPRQIAIWYQNRRARWKSQSLELHNSALQVKLDSALAEMKTLETEMAKLREELKRRAEEMSLIGGSSLALHQTGVSSISPNYNSSCCDEGMSSSFKDEGLLHFDELYGSLVGVEDGSNSSSSWANRKDFWV